MRRTLLVGAVLTVAAALVVVLSDLLDLKLESVALLGVALGAVVALAYTAVIDDPTRFAKSMGAASLMLQVCCAVLNDKLGPASVGHPKLTSILLPT